MLRINVGLGKRADNLRVTPDKDRQVRRNRSPSLALDPSNVLKEFIFQFLENFAAHG
jgi:hypothetical protein